MNLHALLRARSTARAITSPGSGDWVTRGDVRLDDATVERLALALHERRHGAHVPEHGKAECARLSGAYDDVYVLEPLIVDLLKGQPA